MGQTITIPAIVAMVSVARRGVAGLLAGSPHAEDAELVTTELVTNAMRHSVGEIVIRVYTSDAVRIEVRDQRGRHPRVDAFSVEADGPNGLAIVSAIAEAIGSSRSCSGDCSTWVVLSSFPDASPDLPSGPDS